ncbi:MAG: hypothetical protein JKX76_01065 [Colwellia sp.]|nr:hypothetical protein [Colwellia sp.]
MTIIGILLIVLLLVYTIYGGSALVCGDGYTACGTNCVKNCTGSQVLNGSCVCVDPSDVTYTCIEGTDTTLPFCGIDTCNDDGSDPDCYTGMGKCSSGCYMTDDAYYLYNPTTGEADVSFQMLDFSSGGSAPTAPYTSSLQQTLTLCNGFHPVDAETAISCFTSNTDATCTNSPEPSSSINNGLLQQTGNFNKIEPNTGQHLVEAASTRGNKIEGKWDSLDHSNEISEKDPEPTSSSTYNYYAINYSSRCITFMCSSGSAREYVCLEPYSSIDIDDITLFTTTESSYGINTFQIWDDKTTAKDYSLAQGKFVKAIDSATFNGNNFIVFQDMECDTLNLS